MPDQERYWLVKHVFFCNLGDGAVLLDLRRDRYLGMSADAVRALSGRVMGWPEVAAKEGRGHERLPDSDVRSVLDSYTAAGVITRNESDGKPATVLRITDSNTLIDLAGNAARRRPVSTRDVGIFLLALAETWSSLRRQSIYQIFSGLAARARSRAMTFDPEAAALHLHVFRCIRPYFLRLDGRCLKHALLLVNFLARYDVYPDLVIGVKAPPFLAHSWVQAGKYVLDATPEEVCFYQPILTSSEVRGIAPASGSSTTVLVSNSIQERHS